MLAIPLVIYGAILKLSDNDNGQIIVETTTDNHGVWQISANNLANGTYNLSAIAMYLAIAKRAFNQITLSGITSSGATLILEPRGATTTADGTGLYSFTVVNLVGGDNAFTVRATDIAGNTSTFSTTIYRF